MKNLPSRRRPKIAVVGCGYFGRFHARCLKEMSNICELTGIYDHDAGRLAEVSGELGVDRFSSYDEVLGSELDFVTIATSTSSHYKIAKDFLLRGISVFVEKPITLNYSEAQELFKIAEDSKLRLQVGFIERFNPCLRYIKNIAPASSKIEISRGAKPRAIESTGHIIDDLLIHDVDIVANFCFPGVFPTIVKIHSDSNECHAHLKFDRTDVVMKAYRSSDESSLKRCYDFTRIVGGNFVRVDLQNNCVEAKSPSGNNVEKLKIQEINKLQIELEDFVSGSFDSEKNRGYLKTSEIISNIKKSLDT